MEIQTSDLGKVVLAEHVEQLENPDFSMFAEELRRMQNYDAEVCPTRWREAVKYVIENGYDDVELLRRFGERKFVFPVDKIEQMIAVYNHAFRVNKGLSEKVKVELPLESVKAYSWYHLASNIKSNKGGEVNYSSDDYNSDNHSLDCSLLDDKIPGFSILFLGRRYKKRWGGPRVVKGPHIYGFPKKDEEIFFDLGEVDTSPLRSIAKRRFIYTFGISPLEDKEIIDALVELNGFPKETEENGIRYRLEEATLSKLKHSRGIALTFKEAKKAKNKGLFAEVKVYKLVAEREERIRDPVIVGIDPFGQKYPIVYWSGDEQPK